MAQGMKIKYFEDTDTLYMEFRETEVVMSRDLDEDTRLDCDSEGRICTITLEHAKARGTLPSFSYELVPARDFKDFLLSAPDLDKLGIVRPN